MIKYIWSRLKYLDIPLMILSGLLILIGVVVLYATSLSDGNMSLVYRQVAAVVGGSVLFFFFTF
jgi:cell division protein FtsW (lipid II flippase)